MKALLLNLWDRIQDEPILVSTAVGAVLGLFIAFGVPITVEQKVAIVGAIMALLALFARKKATPVSNPTLPSGTMVNVTTPVGQADYQKVV